MTPLISVIMSAYNADKYLLESVASILNQEYANFEFIIVNDGSVDNTSVLLKQIKESDSRVRIIDQENKGLASSLNTAIQISKGEYIARMDADDIANSTRLSTQLEFLNRFKDIDILGSYVEAFGDSKVRVWTFPETKEDCDVALLFLNPLAHPAVMFRRRIIDDTGLYDLSFNYDQDYELWARASASHGISNINKVLLKYRIHGNQMGSVFSKGERTNSQKRTQLFLLNEMGLTVSDEDMEIHLLLANAYRLEFEFAGNYDILKKVSLWIKKITETNRRTNRYNDLALRKRLYTHYHALCLYLADNGFGVYKEYKVIANYLGFNAINLTLMISCLFRSGRKEHLVLYNLSYKLKNIIRNVVGQ
ncbi:MAG: glycosyltransferase [Bacteroidetes bacterium]|nr:glycosyltransferase [Bacteroidota bacterium]